MQIACHKLGLQLEAAAAIMVIITYRHLWGQNVISKVVTFVTTFLKRAAARRYGGPLFRDRINDDDAMNETRTGDLLFCLQIFGSVRSQARLGGNFVLLRKPKRKTN